MDIRLIGPILSVIAIGVTITLWLKGRSRKALSYDVISSTSLVMQHDEIGKKIKIMFEDKEITDNVILVLLKITNSGNTPIIVNDFTQDISIETTSGSILIAEVKETNPKNLDVKLRIDNTKSSSSILSDKVSLSPLLLNGKDEIVIKLLIKQPEDKLFEIENLKVNARIVGIFEITKLKKKKFNDFYFTIFTMLPFTIVIATIIPYLERNSLAIKYIMQFVLPLLLGFSFAVIISIVRVIDMKKIKFRRFF